MARLGALTVPETHVSRAAQVHGGGQVRVLVVPEIAGTKSRSCGVAATVRASVDHGPGPGSAGRVGSRVSEPQRARLEVVGPGNLWPTTVAGYTVVGAAVAARAVGSGCVDTARLGIACVGRAFVAVTAVRRHVGTLSCRRIAAINRADILVIALLRVGALAVRVADCVGAEIAVVAIVGGGARWPIGRIIDVERKVLICQILVARDAVSHQVVGDDLDGEVSRTGRIEMHRFEVVDPIVGAAGGRDSAGEDIAAILGRAYCDQEVEVIGIGIPGDRAGRIGPGEHHLHSLGLIPDSQRRAGKGVAVRAKDRGLIRNRAVRCGEQPGHFQSAPPLQLVGDIAK